MTHDDYKSTYTFYKDNIKVTVGLSWNEQIYGTHKREENDFLSKLDFELGVEEASQVYVMESNLDGSWLQ